MKEKAGFITLLVLLFFCNMAIAKGHDTIVVDTIVTGQVFTGCTVVHEKDVYLRGDCDHYQELGNTILSGTPTEELPVFVFLPGKLFIYPYRCYLVDESRYKNETVYNLMCDDNG